MAETEDQGGGGGAATDPRLDAINDYTSKTLKVRVVTRMCGDLSPNSPFLAGQSLFLVQNMLLSFLCPTFSTALLVTRLGSYKFYSSSDVPLLDRKSQTVFCGFCPDFCF